MAHVAHAASHRRGDAETARLVDWYARREVLLDSEQELLV
jgi:hypothetical protein